MKKEFAAMTAALLISASMLTPASAVSDAPATSAGACILVHAGTGTVLYEHNADARMLIASTTKLMTALVVSETCRPGELVEILPEDTAVEGSSMYLAAGETYSVEQLLYGLILASGNDAALALARHAGGTVDDFVRLMNQKASELGLQNTSFRNPHGLDADGHYGSARDLAVIMEKFLENDVLANIAGSSSYTCHELTYLNHNKLLWTCDGCIGGKTGYTMAAGRSLVSCCERDGMRLICVTISDPDDWNDHRSLYDWAYGEYTYSRVLPEELLLTVPVISGVSDRVEIIVSGDGRVLSSRDSEITVRYNLPRFVYAGVDAGDTAGSADIYINGEKRGSAELIYADSVVRDEKLLLTAWERFKRAWFMANRYGYRLTGVESMSVLAG